MKYIAVCIFLAVISGMILGCGNKDVGTLDSSAVEEGLISEEKPEVETSEEIFVGAGDDEVEKKEFANRVSENKTFEIEVDDSEVKEIVDKVVQIKEGEKLEKAEWIEEGILFRVAVERTEAIPHEYLHLRDYIFVKKDGVKWFEVVYPSKLDFDDPDRYVNSGCDFSVRYEDVTFDGNADVLISLGDAGPNRVFCAYVYEDGEFCYKKSFENIPFLHVDYEEKTIIGFITDGYSYQYEAKYAYEDGEFVLKSETNYKWDDALGKYVIKE